MYEELVKRLRNCATEAAPCKNCDRLLDERCTDSLMKEAANAIEKLQERSPTEGEILKGIEELRDGIRSIYALEATEGRTRRSETSDGHGHG